MEPKMAIGPATRETHRIEVYQWKFAPGEYRELSTHGGDEDWVIVCDDSVDDAVSLEIVDRITYFAQRVEYNGRIVYITAHA